MAELPEDFEIGRAASTALGEVRTVYSRAVTALKDLENLEKWGRFRLCLEPSVPIFEPAPGDGQSDRVEVGRYIGHTESVWIEHPDKEKILAAMREVVRILEPWKRTGRTQFGV